MKGVLKVHTVLHVSRPALGVVSHEKGVERSAAIGPDRVSLKKGVEKYMTSPSQ
jgi:hypothetical protein